MHELDVSFFSFTWSLHEADGATILGGLGLALGHVARASSALGPRSGASSRGSTAGRGGWTTSEDPRTQ